MTRRALLRGRQPHSRRWPWRWCWPVAATRKRWGWRRRRRCRCPHRSHGDHATATPAAAGQFEPGLRSHRQPAPFATKAEADAAVADIRARGRLIVGLDIGSNLFSFRDPITGEITGFDVDIAGEVARDIFGVPSHVEYRILSAAERVTALQKSQVDIVVKTMSITCERRKLVNFSTVYLDANQRILAPRDSPITKVSDLSGKRVCVARGTTSLRRIREIAPPPVIVSVVNWADCLVALQQREIDAVSTDDTILAGLVEEDPYLHIVGPDMADQPYGVGINLDNTGLVRFVNGTLERIRNDGTWNTLYRKWLTVLGPAPAPPTPRYVD